MHILRAHGIQHLADIRTVPRSRHNPQFNRDALPESLSAHHILYSHMPGLGGLRKPRPDSPNQGWKNDSFRGYADYMLTPEFEESLRELIAAGVALPTVMMCAEAVPWRCHRSLVADALLVRGYEVKHLQSAARAQAHRLTPFARVQGQEIIYAS